MIFIQALPAPAMRLLLSLAAFSACLLGHSHARAAEENVQFWTMQLSPHNDVYVKDVIARFEAGHPGIRVKWTDVPWAEMERKTLASVAAGTAPDVVNLNPQFAARLAEFGALADPAAYLDAAAIAAYLPAAWKANSLDGKVFALPWYLNTNITLFNRDLLLRADATVPADLDQLVATARKIKARTGTYAYFPALDASTPLEALVASGAPLLRKDQCGAGLANAGGAHVFETYRVLYQEDLVPRNVVTEGHRKAVEMFLSGQIGMVSTGMQFLDYIKNNNPGIYSRIDVAPQINTGRSPASIAAMNVAVLEKSPRKGAAFKFAQFLTNSDNQLAFARRVPILPSTTASYRDPYFTMPVGEALMDKARALSVRQVLSGAVLVPPMRKYSKLRVSYARNLQAVMLNKKTVTGALGDIDREWAAILGCGV